MSGGSGGRRPRASFRAWLGRAALVGLLTVLAGCGGAPAMSGEEPLVVGAAADLRPAFTEIGAAFEERTGRPLTFSFGSSGQLAQQLTEGAPFDVYASADVAFVDRVVAAGIGDPATQATYAVGRLALWASGDGWNDWAGLAELAADPGVETVAIANPEHAPYGRAAQQALERAGVWDDLESRLVYGQNVADTQRLAATGNADAAVVALSLALAADAGGDGRWQLIDDDLHDPVRQGLVVTAADADRAAAAAEFVDFLDSDTARATMRRFGFAPSGGDPPAAWTGG